MLCVFVIIELIHLMTFYHFFNSPSCINWWWRIAQYYIQYCFI